MPIKNTGQVQLPAAQGQGESRVEVGLSAVNGSLIEPSARVIEGESNELNGAQN